MNLALHTRPATLRALLAIAILLAPSVHVLGAGAQAPADFNADDARADAVSGALDLRTELGYQARAFAARGVSTRDRWQQGLRLAVLVDGASADARWQWHADLRARVDDMDDRRSGADVREAYVRWVGDDAEVALGARRVFWGVTEFAHLVDVLNQVDLVENIDEEERLGQPMLQVELPRGAWNLQAYVLPLLRERTFPGRDGRQHGGVTPHDDAVHAPSLRGQPLSFAARAEWHGDGLDVGLAHFSGAGREPSFALSGIGRPRPVYEHVEQTSLDVSWLTGDIAWKLEAYRRSGQGAPHVAAAAGLERTWVGLFGRGDLGLVLEYLHDERDKRAPPGRFEHDVAVGLRYAANDSADTTLLLGLVQDVHSDERTLSLEATSRLAPGLALAVEARVFGGNVGGNAHGDGSSLNALIDPDNKTGFLDRDDYVQLELTTYF